MSKGKSKRHKGKRYDRRRELSYNAGGKAFGGRDLYTMEDEEIIRSVIANDPDWTLHDVKAAITTVHPLSDLKRHVASFMPIAEVEAHMYEPARRTVTASTPKAPNGNDGKASALAAQHEQADIVDETESTPTQEEKEMTDNNNNNNNQKQKRKSSMTRWSDNETSALKSVWPSIGSGLDTEAMWAALLPGRSLKAISLRASYIGLTRERKRLAVLDPSFNDDDNEMLMAFFDEYGADTSQWNGMLSRDHTTQELVKQASALKAINAFQKQTPDKKAVGTDGKPARKPESKDEIPKPTATNKPAGKAPDDPFESTNGKGVPTAELLDGLRSLSTKPGVKVEVRIDFGNGLRFELDNTGE